MALLIENSCINCDMCDAECPNEAISMGAEVYEIDAEKCTECVGHYDTAQCVSVCPIDCIKPDELQRETNEQLLAKFTKMHR